LKNHQSFKYLKQIKGFTLIEVLIAITVLSFLMANIYTMVDNATRTKEDVTVEDRDILLVQAAFERFSVDFSQIYSPLYYSAKAKATISNDGDSRTEPEEESSYIGSERFPSITVNNHLVPTLANDEKTELIFMTSSNRRVLENTKQSRYSWIRYSIRSSKTEPRNSEGALELVRAVSSTSPYSKDFNWDKVKEYVLLGNISDFAFEFWNPDREKFVDSLKLMDKHKETPRLVKMKLTWVDKNNTKYEQERSFRILWPYFDTEADEKLKNTFDKKGDVADTDSDSKEEEL
jgi:prepilin-type N-terminal cleavage/methylation domain-containing protein